MRQKDKSRNKGENEIIQIKLANEGKEPNPKETKRKKETKKKTNAERRGEDRRMMTRI